MRISYSAIEDYNKCSQRWYYRKLGWQELEKPDNLALGVAFHAAIAAYFKPGGSPTKVFDEILRKEKKGHPGMDAFATGNVLLTKFLNDPVVLRLKNVKTEVRFERELGGGDQFVGVIDCIAELDGKTVLIDWKSSSSSYDPEFYQTFGEQLTAYKFLTDLTNTKIDLFGYGVIGKNNRMRGEDPQWVWVTRSPEQVDEFEKKVRIVLERMKKEEHFKQPDMGVCMRYKEPCPFLQLCQNKEPKGIYKSEF